MLRSLTSPVLAIAAAALFAGPAAAQVPAGAEEAAKLEKAERDLIRAANDWRISQGVAPLVWSEQLAAILREQCTKAVASGYEGGGAAPRSIGRSQQRARDLHNLKTQLFDNYSTATPEEFKAENIIKEQLAHPQIKQFPNGELRLGAAAVLKSKGGKWICLIGLARGGHEQIQRIQVELEPQVSKLDSGDGPTRLGAIDAIVKTRSAEGLAGLRKALRHKDAATRAKAAAAMKSIRSRGIIPPLIAALRDADASVTKAAAASLSALVGRDDLGDDVAKWTEWWSKAIDTFKLPADGSGAQDTTLVGKGAAAGRSVDELLKEWNAASKRKDNVAKVSILEALRDMPESVKNRKVHAVMKKALGAGHTDVRIEAIRGVARLKMRSAVSALMKMVDLYAKKDEKTARFALLGIAQIGDLKGLKTFTKSAWSSKSWGVLATRVFAVRYMRHGQSVDWLLSLFTAGKGRGRGKWGRGGGRGGAQKGVFDSLEFLTGESFGREYDAWKDWWKRRKNSFRPESLPDEYEVEGLFPRKKPDPAERKRNRNRKKGGKGGSGD